MIVILSLLVLVFTGRYLIKVGHQISTEVLKNVIQVETKGKYEIDFDDLALSFRNKKISISGLSLLPILDKSEFQSTIYEIGIDSVVIHLESLKSIYLDRELAIDSVRIVDPRLQLINPEKSSDSLSFTLQTGNLYQVISDQLAILRIDKFHIENGNLAHSPSNFNLQGFDFSMDGLLMDSVVHEKRVFYSTNIVLEINNQRMLLSDSIHEVGFDKFILSTSDSVLRFKNAYIKPTKSSGLTFNAKNEVNIYDVKVPTLGLVGVDYIKAYNDNVLSIEEVLINQPDILIDNENRDKTTAKSGDNNILKLLTNVFDELRIGKFLIKEANVDLKLNSGGSDQRLSSKRTDIAMYGMLLDTANADLDERNKYFDSARFTLLDYAYNLPDSIHRLEVEKLTLNSSDSSIHISNLQLSPERNPNAAQTLIYLTVPNSELSGVAFKEAIIGDRLRLRDFKIDRPQLRVLPKIKKTIASSDKPNLTPKDLYKIISIRYRDFYSRSLQIADGQIEIAEKGSISNFGLQLRHIALDRNDQLWTDLFDQLAINTGKIRWTQDTLNYSVDKISVSKKGRQATANGLLVEGTTSDFRFNTDQIILSGHRPNQLITRGFYTDTLKLVRPVLDWSLANNKGSLSQDTVNSKSNQIRLPKQMGYLMIDNGALTLDLDSTQNLVLGDINLSMSNDMNQPLDWLSLGDISARISSPITMGLTIDNVNYDRFSRNAVVENTRLQGSDSLWFLTQKIVIAGIYQKGLFNDSYLLGSRIFLEGLSGQIDIAQLPTNQKERKQKPKISFGQVLLKSNELEAYLKEGQSLNWRKGELQINEFSFADHELLSEGSFLFGKEGVINGSLTFKNPKQQQTLQAIGFDLDQGKETLEIDSVTFSNEKTLKSVVRQLSIEGLNLSDFKLNNRIKLKNLTTVGSQIQLIRKKDQITRQILSLPLAELSIDSIYSHHNNWVLQDEFTQKETRLNELLFDVQNLKLDSLTNMNRWFDYVSQMEFSGSDFDQPISEDYNIQVEDYTYNLTDNKVQLDGIRLKPKLDKYAYSQKIQSQKSWFDVTAAAITIEDIDHESMSKGRYVIRKVNLDQVNAEVYRDKNNPFPENQYRPMPQKSLHDLNFPVWIDTVSINANIVYAERPIDSDLEGVMTFDDIKGYVVGVRSEDTLSKRPMMFFAQGKLFDQAPFNLKVRFDQKAPMYPFTMQGSVTDFDLMTLNQMLGPVAGVNIRSGYGDEIEFNFTANDKIASGDMRFRYDDLKITILNKKTHEAQGLGRGIKTFFANTFVVQKKNPRFFFVKKGQIFYERDTSRALFNYWGKALISGAVSSIGINKTGKAQKRYQKNLEDELTDD